MFKICPGCFRGLGSTGYHTETRTYCKECDTGYEKPSRIKISKLDAKEKLAYKKRLYWRKRRKRERLEKKLKVKNEN